MICPHCKTDTYTRLREWYMGKRRVWWCDHCFTEIPTLYLVR